MNTNRYTAETMKALLRIFTKKDKSLIRLLYFSNFALSIRQIIDAYILEVCNQIKPIAQKLNQEGKISEEDLLNASQKIRFCYGYINLSRATLDSIYTSKELEECESIPEIRKLIVRFNITKFPNYPTIEMILKKLEKYKLVMKMEGSGKVKAFYALYPKVYIALKKHHVFE